MTQFGKTLREAREAKGLTIAQMAETTRLMPSMVKDLENENFSHIAAPIYGRGFVKLYCEAVGLEPKPYIAEFMEIYSGNRQVEIKERRAPAPEPVPPVAVPPVAVPPVAVSPVAVPPVAVPPVAVPPVAVPPVAVPPVAVPPVAVPPVVQPAAVIPPVAVPPVSAPPRAVPQAPAPVAEPEPAPEPKRSHPSRFAPAYAHEKVRFQPTFHFPRIPPIFWRIGALVLATLVVLWMLMIGLRALYHATTGEPKRTPTVEKPSSSGVFPKNNPLRTPRPVAAPASVKKAAPVRTNRTPQDIPTLYID